MKNFVPKEKLSKKARRELNAKARGTWNGVNPITKKVESSKVYNRKAKKAQAWRNESMVEPFVLFADVAY